jgi:hypothetical protein
MDLMPKNEEAFLPPSKRATGRKPNPNRGYKCPNPHTVKPLPQETLELKNWTVYKPLFQQRTELNF